MPENKVPLSPKNSTTTKHLSHLGCEGEREAIPMHFLNPTTVAGSPGPL
jgi:hypothetical protein